VSTLTYQQASVTGAAFATQAAQVGGDKVAPHSRGAVLVTNGSGSSITVTIATPGTDKYGQARPDIPVTVAAGASKLIGPFPPDLADSSDGLVALSYSDVTTVTVAALLV
jgi:hypothetical protein